MTLRTSARLYSDASLGGVLRCDSNKGVPLKWVIGAYILILGDYIGGITDPNNRVLGPNYSNIFFWGVKGGGGWGPLNPIIRVLGPFEIGSQLN